jgi:outer membrane lipoprotein-sorting protein
MERFGASQLSGLRTACVLLLAGMACAAESARDAAAERWIAAATHIATWQSGIVQTRFLPAMDQPLVSTGRVWFAQPSSFRWELGTQSLALREGEELVLLSPRLRRAEIHSLGAGAHGPVKDLLALLDAGFPRDAAEFGRRFEIVSTATNGPVVVLKLKPRQPTARRWMPGVTVEFDHGHPRLHATEMTFADGSRMRTEFFDVVTNAPIDAGWFRTNLDAGWKVVRSKGTDETRSRRVP